MISLKELLHGHNISDVTTAQEFALVDLQARINIIREAYGKPMIVTSGFRTRLDQERINPKVTKSAHMEGKAVDILDEDGTLHQWCKDNDDIIRKAGLYLEERQGNWQHFQSRPFGSYTGRTVWFKP